MRPWFRMSLRDKPKPIEDNTFYCVACGERHSMKERSQFTGAGMHVYNYFQKVPCPNIERTNDELGPPTKFTDGRRIRYSPAGERCE
jgi:hypothetical protein